MKKNKWKVIGKIFYGIFLVLFVIIFFILIFSSFNLPGSLKFYVVKSGSMEPAIKTGSMVIDKKSNQYKVGDIITFVSVDNQETITHRIADITKEGSANAYRTQGDANGVADSFLVTEGRIMGRVVLSIPFLGYLTAFIKSGPGFVILIVIPATIIVYQEVGNIREELKKHKKVKVENDKENKDKS